MARIPCGSPRQPGRVAAANVRPTLATVPSSGTVYGRVVWGVCLFCSPRAERLAVHGPVCCYRHAFAAHLYCLL